MKIPAPPEPEFLKPDSHSVQSAEFVRRDERRKSKSNSTTLSAFDVGFIGRIIASILAVGAFAMIVVVGATRSPVIAISVFLGFALNAVLLKSQELFVRRVMGPVSKSEKNLWLRAPLALVLILKYVVVGAVLGLGLEFNWIFPSALGAGFVAGQVVIVAKVIGRFAALKMRATGQKPDQNIESHVA